MNDSLARNETPARRRVVPLVWRLVLVMAGALLIWAVVDTRLIAALFDFEAPVARRITSAVTVCILGVTLVLILRRYLDRRPTSTLGLQGGVRAVRDFAYGALTWLAPAALGLTVALLFGWVEIQINSSIAEVIGAVALLIALVFVHEALPEELIFRGYILRNLSAVVAVSTAILIQALLFCAFGLVLWVSTEGWGVFIERAAMFFFMGLVLGSLRVISGSLWACMGFHVAFQVVMQLVLGSSYADITVDSELAFTLSTAVVAFIAATSVAGWLWRGEVNWIKPEPDITEPDTSSDSEPYP